MARRAAPRVGAPENRIKRAAKPSTSPSRAKAAKKLRAGLVAPELIALETSHLLRLKARARDSGDRFALMLVEIHHALVVAAQTAPEELVAVHRRASSFLKTRGHLALLPSGHARTNAKRVFIRTVGKIVMTLPEELAPHAAGTCEEQTPACRARYLALRILKEGVEEEGFRAVAGDPRHDAEDRITRALHDMRLAPGMDAETIAARVCGVAYDRPMDNLWKFLDMKVGAKRGKKTPSRW